MQELEKILEEIDQRIEKAEKIIVDHPSDKLDEIANDTAEAFIEAYKECQDIIHKHLSRENDSEITRLSRDNDGWIPVEERLPETNEDGLSEDVLVSFSDSHSRCIGFYDFNKKRWYVHESCPYIGRLIAWRPLPEPYRPERNRP